MNVPSGHTATHVLLTRLVSRSDGQEATQVLLPSSNGLAAGHDATQVAPSVYVPPGQVPTHSPFTLSP